VIPSALKHAQRIPQSFWTGCTRRQNPQISQSLSAPPAAASPAEGIYVTHMTKRLIGCCAAASAASSNSTTREVVRCSLLTKRACRYLSAQTALAPTISMQHAESRGGDAGRLRTFQAYPLERWPPLPRPVRDHHHPAGDLNRQKGFYDGKRHKKMGDGLLSHRGLQYPRRGRA